jgi:putative tricarboxylic transport membrane protein
MRRSRTVFSVLVMLVLVLAACGTGQGDGAETDAAETDGGQPPASEPTGDTSEFTEDVEIVVHSGPGGGNDTLARAMAQILLDEGLADTLYPVSNVEGGSGAAAMAYMAEQAGEPNTWAVHTSVWLSTPLTLGGDAVTVEDLSPIAQLVEERGMIGVAADSPYETLQDLLDAAATEQLIHAGGSVGSLDHVNSMLLQQAAGVEWDFLSYPGGGERVAAVLGGNAHIMIEGARDFSELVESGDMRVLAALSGERNPIFPDIETAAEATGLEPNFVIERRGVIGPPDMPEEAIAYWAGVFEDMMQTDAWKEFSEESGFVDTFGGPDVHASNLAEQQETLRGVFEGLGLLEE